jgi:hypothetical protein
VHLGFQTAWDEVSSTITSALAAATAAYPSYKVIATGHSLGAAVATIGVATLRAEEGFDIDIWTYGSPRAGNAAFAEFVSNQTSGVEIRVTHFDDPVPRLPPLLLGYRHTSPEYWLSDGNATTVNYTVSDIKVCTGIANVSCNAGTTGLDASAHDYYFQKITGCQGSVTWRRDGSGGVSDEQVEERIGMLAVVDREYGVALGEYEAGLA